MVDVPRWYLPQRRHGATANSRIRCNLSCTSMPSARGPGYCLRWASLPLLLSRSVDLSSYVGKRQVFFSVSGKGAQSFSNDYSRVFVYVSSESNIATLCFLEK
jgi:hypothetical protein